MRKLWLILAFAISGITVNAINILTPSGYKDLSAVSVGDSVTAYDITDGHIIYNTIELIEPLNADWFIAQGDSNFTWYLINGTYRVFKYQSIWNTPVSCVHAFELHVGDTIYNDQNNNVAVTSITEATGDSVWARLEISGDHSFISEGITLHNASRFWVTGGTDNNWSTTGNWSSGSGGAGGSSLPVLTDDVTLDHLGNSNCTVNTSARSCKTLTIETGGTPYSSTLTLDQNLTVAGNISLGASMGLAGSATLVCSTTSTLTSYGKTCGINFKFSNSVTYTLADNWTVEGTTTMGSGNHNVVINGNTLNMSGNFTVNGAIVSGTTNLVLGGTGTWSQTGTNFTSNNLTINTSGTTTISGDVYYSTGTLTYMAGTVTTTGSNLRLGASGTTTPINTNGMTWNNITVAPVSSAITITLSSNLSASGTVSLGNGTLGVTCNGNTFYAGGNLTLNNTTGQTSGTTYFVMNGTGTLSSSHTTGRLNNNLEINTTGTVTVSGNTNFSAGTFKYTAGTMASSSGNITFMNTTPTVTLNALFVYPGTITTAVNTSFGGTYGFTVGNFTCTTVGITNTLAAGKTYTINGMITLTGTAASHLSMVSSSAGSYAILTLNQGSDQDVGFVNATDIDSHLGLSVWNFKGTNSNSPNWNSLAATTAFGTSTRTLGRIF